MLFLADFSVMNPSFGLLFWTTLVFILVWLVLGKYAFRPITNALKERETSIENALKAAEQARAEMKNLKSDHEKLLEEARRERIRIVNEAQALRDKIIDDAKAKAEDDARKITETAKEKAGDRLKEMEIALFNEIGKLSLVIAKQILQKELEGNHDTYVQQKVDEMRQRRQTGSR